MVCDWKPNSSRELNDPRMPDGGPSVPDQAEDSGPEDEINPVVELGHYQLLPSDMQQGLQHFPTHASDSDSDEDSDDSDGSVPANNLSGVSPTVESSDTGQDLQHKLEGWERTEISVDSDEIRSLMRGFNLPDSAVPEWASTVPESMFASFVWDRIKHK